MDFSFAGQFNSKGGGLSFRFCERKILNMRRTFLQSRFIPAKRPTRHAPSPAPSIENTPIRVTFTGKSCLLPEISMLGWSRFAKAQPQALAAHQHRNCWEICYLLRGQVDWWAGNNSTTLHAGDVYVTPPNQPHGGINAVMQPCELYWIQLVSAVRRPWSGLSLAETRFILEEFTSLRQLSFPGSPHVAELFQTLVEEHQRQAAHSKMLVRAALHQLLVRLLRDHAAQSAEHARPPYCSQIAAAIQFMQAELAASQSLAELAARAGWSVSYFSQRFTRETGLTPTEYRNHQRVRLAKVLLDHPDRRITAIALELGFSSSQYFATVFRQITGLTPREYRCRVAPATTQIPGSTH